MPQIIDVTMESAESILTQYFLIFKKFPKSNEGKPEISEDIRLLNNSILSEDNWKIFFETSCDTDQIKQQFNSKSEEERINIFKFGIGCLINFVRCNFTGPDFDKTTEEFLCGQKFSSISFSKLLSVRNEDINVNTRFPALLVVSKLIFELCPISTVINVWWLWRSIIIHQQILDELSPSLLSDADRLYKHIQVNPNIKDSIKASLDIEVAQLYILFRHVSKAKEHISSASGILGINYKLIGALGKRTKHQEKEIAQLTLKVTVDGRNSQIQQPEEEEEFIPKNVPLNDDVRLNSINFSSKDVVDNVSLTNIEQKFFITTVQEMLIAKPQDELQAEEIHPFIDLLLNQNNSFTVRVSALLLRSKLESKNRRTIERSLVQCEEIINSFKRENPYFLNRVSDVFGAGLPPIWKVEAQHADLLLNIGLVKNALDIYLKIKLWEEVIVCYTILKLRHKAAEVIQEQLNIRPTVKLMCLLGDATDDETCYEKAWEMSKKRSHRAQRHWGNYLFLRKQYEQSIPHFEKSVSINPLQSIVWFRLGFAALEVENWQTAATAFRRHTTLEPDGFEAWNNLAQAYIKIGNKRNAHQALLEAIRCNFDNWKVWENLLHISSDLLMWSDVIRAYHKLLDLKEKYLNTEVLNNLVNHVCSDANDFEGQPSQRFLKKTRELLGRVTSVCPSEGSVWEIYANLAPGTLLRAQRLQRAYRGYCQGSWEKNRITCQQVLEVCKKLGDIAISKDIDPKDNLINSVRLNLSSAISAVRKQDYEGMKELLEVSERLEKLCEKIKNSQSDVDISRT